MHQFRSQFLAKLTCLVQQGDDWTRDSAHVAYGTAGFRANSNEIQHLFPKVGLIAGLRSLVEQANVGVMITASHNPVQDNGVKLIDSNGGMLAAEWEPIVETFCNLSVEPDNILEHFEKLILNYNIDVTPGRTKPKVLIGRDTRPSCPTLTKLLFEGLNIWSDYLDVVDYGLVTTPALHYLVAESNKLKQQITLQDYYDKLSKALVHHFDARQSSTKHYTATDLVVDCANGVGIKTMESLCNDKDFIQRLPLKLINHGDGVLNQTCGADYVKTKLLPPTNADKEATRYASLDGDADRVVYFYLESQNGQQKLRLLDGDKIMALYAFYLKDVIKRANLDDKLSLGIIQTAYANGASTDYLRQQLGLNVDCVDTGVKNLHRRALDFDIAIYFEANGHGTIWVSSVARNVIETSKSDAGAEMSRLLKILNNYTGDAISDILIVEAILNYYDMNIENWYKFYEDRPNSLIKVEVKDRALLKTTDAGRTCLEPVGLQEIINSIVAEHSHQARCFVRASGTENVVRVYAEAKTQEDADKMAQQVGEKVIQMCNA